MSTTATTRPTPATTAIKPKAGWQHALSDIGNTFRMLRRNRGGFIGFLLVVLTLLISFVGPLFIELDTANRISQVFAPASREFPLGTDFQGRSVLPQVIHGGLQAIIVALLAATISTVISVVLGALSAYVGGRTDSLITAVADVMLTLPQFILLAVLAAIYRPRTVFFLAVVLGLITWPALLRAVRAQALSIRERDYIEAARSLGLSRWHVIVNEILPNMAGFIIISFILSMTAAMIAQVNLVALGLVPISGTNWAITIFKAQQTGAIYFPDSLFYILGPIIAIVIFQFGLVLLTRSLEEIFNPRLRGNL